MSTSNWAHIIVGLVVGACIGRVTARWTRTIPLYVIASALARTPKDAELVAMLGQVAGRPAPAWRGWTIVGTMAVAVAAMVWRYGAEPGIAVLASGFAIALVLLAWIDGETHLLPDVMTWPLLGAGLIVNANGAFVPIEQASMGAALGYGVIWLSAWGFEKMTGREGIGLGDAKLFGSLGAWLGLWILPSLYFGAAVLALGGMLAKTLRAGIDGVHKPHPFGPYLAISAMVGMLAR